MTEDIIDDVTMMKSPEKWPHWVILPLKSRKCEPGSCFPQLGILIKDKGPIVFLTDMFSLARYGGDIGRIPQKTYSSYEEIVADGWMVD